MSNKHIRIAHVDLDSFFVSAERLSNPALRGIPMAVGGSHGRGVISSASYEARKKGVRSAMPVKQALKLCPELKLVPSNFELYSKLSKQVFEVLAQITPIVDPVSVDEAYLDLTGVQSMWKSAWLAGEEIRKRIFQQTGLTITVAIASSRTVAKIATDQAKPDGLIEIPEGDEAKFLADLPVSVIPGVGPKLLERLNEVQVFRIRDLREMGLGFLQSALGGDAVYFRNIAEGKGSTQFFRQAQAPSVSRETTFTKNVETMVELNETLTDLVTDLASDLFQSKGLLSGIELKLRNPDFQTWSRSQKFRTPTRSVSVIKELSQKLLNEAWDRQTPIRLIGVGGKWLSESEPHQLDLWNAAQERKEEKIQALNARIKDLSE